MLPVRGACEGCTRDSQNFVTGFFGLPAQKSILNACNFQATRKFAAHKPQVAFEPYHIYLGST